MRFTRQGTRRLSSLPQAASAVRGLEIHVATSVTARMAGLAGSDELHQGTGLLLPRTRSVHTYGMRFALDLVWLDAAGRALRVDAGVPPHRARTCLRARDVLELAAGQAVALAIAPGRLVIRWSR